MNEKLLKFKTLILDIIKSVFKHNLILIASLISTIFGSIFACLDYNVDDSLLHLWLAFLFATLCMFSCCYLTKKLALLKKYLIQVSTFVITAAGSFLLLHYVKDESYMWMYYLGLTFTVICFTVFVFVPKNNSESFYANIFKNFLFCGLVALSGFLGAILLVYAYSSLIHEVYEMGDVISVLAFIFFEFFYINFYSYYLFERSEEPSGKAFKIIFMYVLLPVYFLLLILLYAYLVKALFLFKLPQGQINWFVSFASVIFIVLYFILQEYKEIKVMKIFYRFGALVLIPLMLVQFPAYFIRVNAYGFTGWRYSSLLFNIFALSFVVFTFIKKGKYVKYAIPVLGLVIIFASLTPANLINVAYNSQYKKLCQILKKYEMFDGKALTAYDESIINEKITEDDKNLLYGSWRYLNYTSEHKKPEWFTNGTNFYEQFKIALTEKEKNYVTYKLLAPNKNIDISGYSKLNIISLYYYDYNNTGFKPPVVPEINYNLEQDVKDNMDSNEILEIYPDETHKIVIYSMRGNYDDINQKVLSYDIDGYLLEK